MATWTHEQSNGSASAGPLAFANNVKLGSLLVAIQENDEAGVPTTPTDSRSNAWQLMDSHISSQRITWWYAVSKDTGACTVTFDVSAGFNGVKVTEWSFSPGPLVFVAADTVERSGTGGTGGMVSPAILATVNGSLVLGVLGTEEGLASTTVAAGTGFVARESTGIAGSANDRFVLESGTADAGSAQATFTMSGTLQTSLVGAAVFSAGVDAVAVRTLTRHARMTSW